MKLAAYSMAAALLLLGGAVTWAIFRGEDTRGELRVLKRTVTVDPCARPRSVACQRRIGLVLRELVKRHPRALRELGLGPRTGDSSSPVAGGGGAGTSPPVGGGPVGRVPPRDSPPAPEKPSPPQEPPAAPSRPLIDLDAPVVPRVCVGDLVGVNCP